MVSGRSVGAQGTIEYLVIIAVVIVISLVVVSLSTNTVGGDISSLSVNASKISSSVGTSGISIVDSVADFSGNGLIKLSNQSGGSLTVTKITAVDSAGNRKNTPFSGAYVPSGGSVIFSLSSVIPCCSICGRFRPGQRTHCGVPGKKYSG